MLFWEEECQRKSELDCGSQAGPSATGHEGGLLKTTVMVGSRSTYVTRIPAHLLEHPPATPAVSNPTTSALHLQPHGATRRCAWQPRCPWLCHDKVALQPSSTQSTGRGEREPDAGVLEANCPSES